MKNSARFMTRSAMVGALYCALCYLQDLLLPGSASNFIQLRVAEALCVLSFFTPAAIAGLSLGCLLYNLSLAGALPLDPIVGTAATALACGSMYLTRNLTLKKLPVLGLLMPALWNGLLVGWELSLYMGKSFWLNACYVALGELLVIATLGCGLFWAFRKHQNRLTLGS